MGYERWRKSVEKKLRHIEDLKRRRSSGASLDAQQQAKLDKEAVLRASLAEAVIDKGSARPHLEVGVKLLVGGRRAKVRRIDEGGARVKVRYSDDKTKGWVSLADLEPERHQDKQVSESASTPHQRDGPQVWVEETRQTCSVGLKLPMAQPPLSSLSPLSQPLPQSPLPTAPRDLVGLCGHCGRPGHEARLCSFGLSPDERFLPCTSVQPVGCFSRTFIVPLRRAPADFDASAPREGRVDVGLRCVSSALFRSQSLRRNTQCTLCLLGDDEASRLVDVLGSMVRDLRPDELSLAARLRAVSSVDRADAA